MGSILPALYGAAACMLDIRGFTQGSIGANRIIHEVAGRIIAGGYPFPVFMRGHITGMVAFRRLCIYKFQAALVVVKTEGGHTPSIGITGFGDRIEEFLIRRQGKVGGVLGGDFVEILKLAFGAVVTINFNAVGRGRGIGADDQKIIVLSI